MATPTVSPACTCRRRRSASPRRRRRIWSSPRRWREAGRRVHRRVVRPQGAATSTRCARSSATRAQLVAKIETHTAITNLAEVVAASDAVMVARGDLGIDCPIEDVPAPAEARRAALRRVGRPGDHGDADARVDDHGAVADAGRGQRHRQRRVRRHRRGDAVRARRRSGATRSGSCARWAASPSGPRARRAIGSGRRASAGSNGATITRRLSRDRPDHRRRHARRLAGVVRRRRVGHPVLHAVGPHGPGDGPVPARGAA